MLGIIQFNNLPVKNSLLQVMMHSLAYHNLNTIDYYMVNNVGLGCHCHQPFTDATGRYTIIMNGEVYNGPELRGKLHALGHTCCSQLDIDIVLNAYIEWGDKMLDEINGRFTIAIYNKEEQTLFLARDRFGVKPMYYCITKESFVFASDIPAILSALPTKPSANENVIFDYLVFNRTDQTEQTFFNGIFKLQHGCCMTLDCKHTYVKDTLPIIKWYDLAKRVQGNTKKKDKETFMYLFTRAIQIRLHGDVPWGVGLSGGLDSSAITSTIINVLKEPNVHSFSAVYGNDSDADESKFIDCFKGIVPNMHYVYPDADSLFANLDNYVRNQVEPIPTTTPFANYCVMQEAQKFVKVVIDGQGADETLSGYEYIPGLYYKTLLTHFKWATLVKELVRYARLHKSMRHIKYMVFFMLPSRMRTKARVAQRGYLNPEFVARNQYSVIADQLYSAKTMQEMLIRHFEYKLEHLLKWGERVTKAFALDSRQPFLDKDLVEYSLTLEDDAKVHDGYTKYILREVMRGIMPESIRMRVDKMGFSVPEHEWFRAEKFQTLIMGILQSDSFAKRGFVIPEEAIKLYKKHLSGKVDVSTEIWKWINLELWYREFID